MSEKWVEVATGVEVLVIRDDHGQVSCNRTTWHPTMKSAYEWAKRDGTLIVRAEEDTGGFHAWVLALLTELQELDQGASLKITRFGDEFTVTREQSVLPPLRASELGDLELRIEDSDD